MEAKICKMDEIKIIAVKCVHENLASIALDAWKEALEKAYSIPGWINRKLRYGVFPESDHIGPTKVYTYWVGIEVDSFVVIPEGMEALTLPAREYAVVRCQGPGEQIYQAYRYLDQWIEDNGYERDPQALGFERYDKQRQKEIRPELYDYDIYKPIRSARSEE